MCGACVNVCEEVMAQSPQHVFYQDFYIYLLDKAPFVLTALLALEK